MSPDDIELQKLHTRWSDGKYKAVLEALESVLPQEQWMDTCDAIIHPFDKKLANDLRGIRISGKDLKNLDLGSSLLDFANFDHCEFNEAHFQWSILTSASFRGCKFHSVQMIPIFGEQIDFSRSEFNRSHIDHAQIENCNFSHIVMRGGNLNQSKIAGSDFSDALIEKGDFSWNVAQRCNFSGVRFVDCDLRASQVSEGNLTDASFDNCDLRGMDFRRVKLNGARFRGGTFGDVHQGSVIRTKFDDTPEARRVVAMSNTGKQDCIEWCSLVPDTNAPVLPSSSSRLKGNPGELVPQSGWWMSPALGSEQGRRYFEAGQKFPDTEMTDWGRVIWSYSPNDQL
ncbi:pentapeptide repeat-containing protein [Paraburkholderia sediminicola]|uniref:pentapeptide repeat-containing protein n=1 Tax=Paraburkholderia TaxID=1822464 RepID=UPI0038BA9406